MCRFNIHIATNYGNEFWCLWFFAPQSPPSVGFCIFLFFFFYPPPYERTVWDYIQPKTNDIKRDIGRFNWEAFLNNCDVNVQVFIFR